MYVKEITREEFTMANESKEILNDYEVTPVPESERMSWLSQSAVFIGASFCLAAISTGGVLANGLSFRDTVLAILFGSLIVTVIGVLCGIISAKTHLSSSVAARFSFGTEGAKIYGVVLAVSLFGWFAFQADMFGSTVVSLIASVTGNVLPRLPFTLIGGVAMMFTAIIGYKAIKWLSNIAVPLLFILTMVALVMTFIRVPLSQIVASGPVETPMTLPVGIASVVGNTAVGVVIVGDFTRYSKNPSDAVKGCILGYTIGYIPILLIGAIFTYAFSNWNVVEVMLSILNMGLIAALVLIVAQWTTNDNNLYSSVLGIANAIDGKIKYKRWALTLIVGTISVAMSAIGLVDHYVSFLSILTSAIPAVGGIVVSDFFVLNKDGYDWRLIQEKKIAKWKWNALISWGVAFLVGLCCTNAPTGFGISFMVGLANIIPTPIICIIVAFVLNCVLYPAFNKKAA